MPKISAPKDDKKSAKITSSGLPSPVVVGEPDEKKVEGIPGLARNDKGVRNDKGGQDDKEARDDKGGQDDDAAEDKKTEDDDAQDKEVVEAKKSGDDDKQKVVEEKKTDDDHKQKDTETKKADDTDEDEDSLPTPEPFGFDEDEGKELPPSRRLPVPIQIGKQGEREEKIAKPIGAGYVTEIDDPDKETENLNPAQDVSQAQDEQEGEDLSAAQDGDQTGATDEKRSEDDHGEIDPDGGVKGKDAKRDNILTSDQGKILEAGGGEQTDSQVAAVEPIEIPEVTVNEDDMDEIPKIGADGDEAQDEKEATEDKDQDEDLEAEVEETDEVQPVVTGSSMPVPADTQADAKTKKRSFPSGGLTRVTLGLASLLVGGGIVIGGYFASSKIFSNPEAEQVPQQALSESMPETPPPVEATPEPEPTATPEPEFDKSTIKVKVLNGSGIKGAAGIAKALLEEDGYEEVAVGNADNFDYEETEIQYKSEYLDLVDSLEAVLSDNYTVVAGDELDDEDEFDIYIVLGSLEAEEEEEEETASEEEETDSEETGSSQ